MFDPASEFASQSDAADERGDLKRFVRQHQMEAQRLAYLMRGDADEALDLARTAFDAYVREVTGGVDIPEPRLRLLELLGQFDLARGGPSAALPEEGPAAGSERARVQQALDLVEARIRPALVLCDVGALSDREACRIAGLEPTAVRMQFRAARQRLRDAAGMHDGGSAFEPLSRLLRDAPQVDLWPALAERFERLARRRQRRARLVSFSLVAAAILVLLGGFVWLTGFSPGGSDAVDQGGRAAQPTTPPPTAESAPTPTSRVLNLAVPTPAPQAAGEAIGEVPEVQLLSQVRQMDQLRQAVYEFNPTDGTTTELHPSATIVLISPDGRWVIYQEALDDGQVTLSAARSGESDLAWQIDVPHQHAAAIQGERLLLARLDSDQAQLAIRVIDISTGDELQQRTYGEQDVGATGGHQLRLFAAPDRARVYLIVEAYDEEQDIWSRTLTTLDADSGEILRSHRHEASRSAGQRAPDFELRGARLTTDGTALYSTDVSRRARLVEVAFIDVETGEREAIRLPFNVREEQWIINVHEVPSNTGRFLYLLYPDRQQVAIIDLYARELNAIAAIGSQSLSGAGFNNRWRSPTQLATAFSLDGERLYFSVVWEKNPAARSNITRSLVAVIDTTSWQILDIWSVPGRSGRMAISADGERLFVSSLTPRGTMVLTTFDTRSGEVISEQSNFSTPEWMDVPSFSSLAQIYRNRYGRMPVVNGVVPADVEDTRMMPAVQIDTGDARLVTGAQTPVEISFVHPVTGRTLVREVDDVRFDPDAAVSVFFTGPDGTVAGLVTERESPGVYTGKIMLDRSGQWEVQVQMDTADGASWTLKPPGTLRALGGLTGDETPGYRLRVRPENPVSPRTLTLRGSLIDGSSLDTLGDDDPRLEQAPEEIELMLYSESGAYVSTTLEHLEGARYLGWARFEIPGTWHVVAVFELPNGQRVQIDAGDFELSPIGGTDLEAEAEPEPDLEESWRRSHAGWPAGR